MAEELTPEQAQRMLEAPRCPACKSLLQAGRSHCAACGAPRLSAKCQDCGVSIEAGKSYCPSCGASRLAAVGGGSSTRAPDPLGLQNADGFLGVMWVLVFVGAITLGVASTDTYHVEGRLAGAAMLGVGLFGLLLRGAIVSAGLRLRRATLPADRQPDTK